MAEPRYVPTTTDRDVAGQATDDEALLRTARARFDRSVEAETELREQFAIDQRFRAGVQWPDNVRNDRESFDQHRPVLTINLVPGAIAQVTNEQRANPATLRVSPTGHGATVEVAKICDGLLRHIQRDSRADIAYETASDEAAGPGRGWFRIVTDYESPTSFDQKLVILSIPNAMSVYPQPNLREPDYSDMDWCFLVEDVAHDEFLSLYPGMSPQDMDVWAAAGMDPWVTRDTVRVAEYFYREYTPRRLALLDDGKVIDQGPGRRTELAQIAATLGRKIVDERTARQPVVWWTKINGRQVLERTQWRGSWIPIIPVIGDRFYVDGRVRISGLIRDSRDSQCMINYWESARTEAIALAPRAPWTGPAGSFEGFEHEWETANTRNHAYLQWQPVVKNGVLMPPPVRNVQEPAIQALNQACQSAKDNFQSTTRIYDASYGAPSNERSGKAIQARDQNSDMSNSHYSGNRRRSLHHAGRICLELLPKIYDEPGRVQRIVHEDGTEKQVTLNERYTDDESGLERFYDLTVGTYDVAVDAGPSYERQRQDGVANMVDMAKADPKIMAVADDLVVGAMPFPGAQDIAKRLKKTIDPKLLDDDSPDKDTKLALLQGQLTQVSEQAQAINAHCGEVEQAHQAALTQVQTLTQEHAALKSDRQGAQQEAGSKEREAQDRRELDRAKLALEQQKIDLAVQQHLLERDKVQAERQQQQAVQAQSDGTQQLQSQVSALQADLAPLAGLPAVLVQLAQSLDALQQAEAQRQAPKMIQMHRSDDGALVGEVTEASGQVVRRLSLAKTGTGYTGEVD